MKPELKEQIEEMIANAVKGNTQAAADIFNQIVSQRAAAATEQIKQDVMDQTFNGGVRESVEVELDEGARSSTRPGFDANKEADKLLSHPRFDNHLGYAVTAAQKRHSKGAYDHELFKKGLQTTVGLYDKYNAEEKRQLAQIVGDALGKKHGFIKEDVDLEEAYGDKRDHKKIDLHFKDNNQYIASTTWSPTCKHAVEKYEEKHPEHKGNVKAYFSSKP